MRGFIIFFLVYLTISSTSAEAFIKLETTPSQVDYEALNKKNIPKEELLYRTLNSNDYKKAEFYLDSILKKDRDNAKYLKLKADAAAEKCLFEQARFFIEKLIEFKKKNQIPTLEDEKALAFYHSQLHNIETAMQIVDNALSANPNDLDLLGLAIKYSMMEKNWDKAMDNIKHALDLSPNSETFLTALGDLHAIKQDYSNAAEVYKKLIELYPKDEYKITLANLYQKSQDFEAAEAIMRPVYGATPTDTGAITTYTNILLYQERSLEAYELIKKHSLEKTKEGLHAQGDIATLEKDFKKAQGYYEDCLKLDEENEYVKLKLAKTLRLQKNYDGAEAIYQNMLAQDPTNINARMNLGYLEIDRKNFKKSRYYFENVLFNKPDSKDAMIGIAYSYIANSEFINALRVLKQLPPDEEVNYLIAKVYYYMEMYSDAKEALKGSVSENADELRYKIRHIRAFTFTPSYTFFSQQLSDTYDLDLKKVGLNLSQYAGRNMEVFTEYNVYVYTSGVNILDNHLNNVTNEFRWGTDGRPSEKIDMRADIGLKVFEYMGDMLNTDSWVRYHFNDFVTLRAGFRRNNLEQSYLSAVGRLVDGVFTGRVAENKAYLDLEAKLPHRYYAFARVGGGAMYAQNLPTNPFVDGMIGFGRVIYNNSENKWINIITADVASYNTSYQFNLLNIPSKSGVVFGGYFSPSYYTANTLNLKFQGKIPKYHIIYGVKGFIGDQTSFGPVNNNIALGILPFLSWDLNDHISVNLSYSFTNYVDIVRHLAIISVNIRGFNRGRGNRKKYNS